MMNYLVIISMLFTTLQQSSKRRLLLYADHGKNLSLKEQLSILHANQAGVNERDLQVEVIVRDKQPKTIIDKHSSHPFTLVLIGKDGGEKLTQHEPISLQKLFGLIDAMPMRKAEMRKKD